MRLRSRMNNHFQKNEYVYLNQQFNEIKAPGVLKISSEQDCDEKIMMAFEEYPEKIILQANVTYLFKQNDRVAIVNNECADKFFVYRPVEGIDKTAISRITLKNDVLISSFEGEKLFFENIPEVLFEKTFNTLASGEYIFHEEKRSLQKNIPEQSLWSYGAIYTSNCDISQLVQYDFFPLIIGSAIKVRFVKRLSAHSFQDDIVNGAVKILIDKECPSVFYQSVFLKQISVNKVHVYLKKIVNEQI
jgi:hypothetical protein